jgi:hypothetical protein
VAKGKEKLTASISIKVATKTPAAHQYVSRGFYQVEEDSLYVPLYPGGKFFSYLDCDQVIFDIDSHGRLLFIQVLTPRHQWYIHDNLIPPIGLDSIDLHFRGFRENLPPARLETPPDRSCLYIGFDRDRTAVRYRLAKNLMVAVTRNATLAGIWITAIEDDRAARAMSAWRKDLKNQSDRPDDDSPYTRIEIKRPPR